MASDSAPHGAGSSNSNDAGSRAGVTQPLLRSDEDAVPEPDPRWSLRRLDRRQRHYEQDIRALQSQVRELEMQVLKLRTKVSSLETAWDNDHPDG